MPPEYIVIIAGTLYHSDFFKGDQNDALMLAEQIKMDLLGRGYAIRKIEDGSLTGIEHSF